MNMSTHGSDARFLFSIHATSTVCFGRGGEAAREGAGAIVANESQRSCLDYRQGRFARSTINKEQASDLPSYYSPLGQI